jgi:hypothetical protein
LKKSPEFDFYGDMVLYSYAVRRYVTTNYIVTLGDCVAYKTGFGFDDQIY